MRVVLFCILFITANSQALYCQSDIDNVNLDSLFLSAKSLAQSSNYHGAIENIDSLLSIDSTYIDALVLKGSILGWQANYDSAEIIINKALAVDSTYKDAIYTHLNVLFWQNELEKASFLAEKYLSMYPDDPLLSDKLAQYNQLIDQKANQSNNEKKNAISVSYLLDFYQKPVYTRRNIIKTIYTREFSKWSLSTAISRGINIYDEGQNRFTSTGFELNFDAYYSLQNSVYQYFNLGFGQKKVFPGVKVGYEFFKTYSSGLGFSLGGRYLNWQDDIFILTGSLSQYFGQYYVSARPYITFIESSIKTSYLFQIRRYLTAPDFVFLTLIVGDSPDQPIDRLELEGSYQSYKTVVGIDHKLTGNFRFGAHVGYQYEEYIPESYRNRIELFIRISYLF